MSKLFSVAEAALCELEPATAVATVTAAEALRRVLEAQQLLSSRPSEAALKQVITALTEAAPDLQQACWLLVLQQDELKLQVWHKAAVLPIACFGLKTLPEPGGARPTWHWIQMQAIVPSKLTALEGQDLPLTYLIVSWKVSSLLFP